MSALTSPRSSKQSRWERWKETRKEKKDQRARKKATVAFLTASQHVLDAQERLLDTIQSSPPPKGKTDQRVADEKKELVLGIQTTQKQLKHASKRIKRWTKTEGERSSPETAKRWWENMLFYGFLMVVLILAGGLLGGTGEAGTPRNIMGYSPMTVLTKSMQRVYPKNSFILTKQTDPDELKIGEDITYVTENKTTITHRIIGITENYMNTGARGFETKGVENAESDEEIVRAANIVGKVVYSSVWLGELLVFIRKNLLLTAVIGILVIFLIDLLMKSFRQSHFFNRIRHTRSKKTRRM